VCPRGIAGAIKKSGVRLAIVNTYPDLTHPDAGERKKQNAGLLSDIDAAAELGAGMVRITAGQAHPGLDTEVAIEWVVDGFHQAARQADKRGIRLAYESTKPGPVVLGFLLPSNIPVDRRRIRDTWHPVRYGRAASAERIRALLTWLFSG
jgi:sugar phosphate isomerase/epimerase